MKKRLLSLAIAICMVAAMLPTFAVSASALEVGEEISYYFISGHATTANISKLNQATEYNEELGRYWTYNRANQDSQGGASQLKMDRTDGDTRIVGGYIALNIHVPEDGTYRTEYYYYKKYNSGTPQGGKGNVYILPGETTLPSKNGAITIEKVEDEYNGKIIASGVDYSAGDASTNGTIKSPVVAENIDLKKGNNILLFLVTGPGENVDTTDDNNNSDHHTYPTSLTLTLTEKAPAEDEELKAAFTPDDTTDVEATVYTDKVTALPYVDGAEVAEGVTATATQLTDGTYQMSTSTTDNGNTFLYWVKGLDGGAKRVVSRAESFVYAPTGGVVNYLIAVYEKNGATTPKAEFYNANGLLYETVEGTSGTTPELPTMAGYGTAKRWVAEGGTTYAGNAPITVTDTMMLIAEYDDPAEDITVTTDENCTTNKPGKKYAYGEKVICTPTGNGTGKFYAWTKDGEIVSTDPEKYEFCAWEDCTVNAVYKEEYTPLTSVARKIIIDVFGNNNVMAEFIGFDNAVEKGIILDSTKITMTSQKSQFTVELGDATSAKGYAVVKNTDGTYTEYIDGANPTTEQE